MTTLSSSPPEYDIDHFRDGLVRHGLIVPTGVAGTFGRGAVFEDVVERFNALVSRDAEGDRPEFLAFPPVIDRRILEKVNYLESFPHLCGSVHSFFGNALQALALAEHAREGGPWGELLGQTEVVLNPASCYPVYPTLTGTLPASGRLISVLGWAYRHEPSPEPTRMQSFRVRELIRAGRADEVQAWRDDWAPRGKALLESLGLPVQLDVASDPFFGRGGKMLAAGQVEQKLKFELLVPVISREQPTAVCSFNYHQDRFGKAFDIRSADDEVAHTACLGYGLERVAMALFKTHGFDPMAWPHAVRARLWP